MLRYLSLCGTRVQWGAAGVIPVSNDTMMGQPPGVRLNSPPAPPVITSGQECARNVQEKVTRSQRALLMTSYFIL